MGGAICLSCGSEVPTGAKFCGDCGTPVAARVCPSCGTPAADRRFCVECGTEVATTASPSAGAAAPVSERRITTVLFGDLVGFTSLSESRDAEDVRELLTRYFDGARTIVERHGGTIEKFIGDAVMAVWGVPSAHEDDAERAVRAGLELVEMARALSRDVGTSVTMRVGLVTGEVATTVGATGQGMVAGDAVNTASRVQSAAEPGQVLVDESTKALTSAAIAYEDAGEHQLKGKSLPLHLFAVHAVVASVRGAERVDGLEAPVAGRDRELRMLKELFHGVEERARPALVLVNGEPGVGKTRLGWEFEKYIDGLSATVRWHRGRCLAYGEGVSLWALAEAIRGRLDLIERDPADVVEQHLDAWIAEHVPGEDERAWLRPRVGVLLGLDASSTFTKDELYAAWTALLERIGSDLAVVLVIDDAQHADDGLLDFVEHLMDRASFGVFVLMLGRPGVLVRRPDLAANQRVTVLHLSPLDESDMGRLVDGLVTGLPARIRDLLVDRAEGIPLYAVETVRGLIDQDLVVPREGRYVVDETASIDLNALTAPASLQTLIASRLDALDALERRVVADASVLGVSFSSEDLASMGSDSDNLDAIVTSLVRKQILALETDRFSAERGQLRFVQTVVRQVAYDTLSRRDRRTRHLAVAARLLGGPRADDEAAVVAQHYLDAVAMSAAGDPDRAELQQRAIALLVTAAHRASALGAPSTALRYLEQALEIAASPSDEAHLRLHAAQVAQDCGRYQDSCEHALAATTQFEKLGDEVRAGQAASVHARSLSQGTGTSDEALAIAQPHWDRLQGRDDADEALLMLASCLARVSVMRGDTDASHHYHLQALSIAEARDDVDHVAATMSAIGIDFLLSGAHRVGRALLQASADLGRELDRPDLVSRALFNLATESLPRDPSEAVRIGREAMASADLAGMAMQQGYSRINLMLALWVTGDWADLDDLWLEPDDLIDDLAQIHRATRIWRDLARLGDAAVLEDAQDLGEGHDLGYQAWQHHIRMLHKRHAGQIDAAVESAAECVRINVEYNGLNDDFMHVWPAAVDTVLAADRLDLAEELLDVVGRAPPGHRSGVLDAHLRHLRGRLRAARDEDAQQVEDDLRAAVDGFTAYGSPPLTARAEETLGRWLVEQGRSDEANEHLSAARAGYEALGAHGWLAAMETRSSLVGTPRP
ncbi:MAG: adenylate/guanylate cyclase domain-containing protein [Candidatus Nanopelagicales bacterium]